MCCKKGRVEAGRENDRFGPRGQGTNGEQLCYRLVVSRGGTNGARLDNTHKIWGLDEARHERTVGPAECGLCVSGEVDTWHVCVVTVDTKRMPALADSTR